VPAHVHVSSGSCVAKFELNCYQGPIVCVKVRGFAEHEVNTIRKELTAILRDLCDYWRDTHGSFT
jgi:hypothetical protein